jgi:hypothetical protein
MSKYFYEVFIKIMSREELIELALQGSVIAEQNEESADIYVDIAEHLLGSGHASTISEIDLILKGMTVESASIILNSVEGAESLSEGHEKIAAGLEADPEGYMVLRQIATAENACLRIKTYIGGDKMLQLPAWVQAKMSIAAADLDTIADYLLSDTEATE